jgi:hypothetical protein
LDSHKSGNPEKRSSPRRASRETRSGSTHRNFLKRRLSSLLSPLRIGSAPATRPRRHTPGTRGHIRRRACVAGCVKHLGANFPMGVSIYRAGVRSLSLSLYLSRLTLTNDFSVFFPVKETPGASSCDIRSEIATCCKSETAARSVKGQGDGGGA